MVAVKVGRLALSILAATTILLVLLPTVSAQSSCSNPGTFSGTNGSQYEYNAAVNTYQLCLVGTVPTNTPTPTATVTPTSTATPTATATATLTGTQVSAAATVVQLAIETGCEPESTPTPAYRTCIIEDAHTRADVRGDYWLPLLFFVILITSLLRFKT